MHQTRDDVKVNGQRASVLIWDTAGTEAFEAVAASYYRRAEGVLLVYDISRRETFEGLTKWYKAVRQYAPEVAIVAVVGHKSDMVRTISSIFPSAPVMYVRVASDVVSSG